MTFTPIRYTNSAKTRAQTIELTSPKIPAPMPARKIFPISEAIPAITITVIACPNAAGSFSISVSVGTSAFIAPTIRPVRSAMHPPAAILADETRGTADQRWHSCCCVTIQEARTMARSGDILGLGDVTPGRGSDEITNRESSVSESSDEMERRRRMRRMNEGADEVAPSSDTGHQGGHGATGIDMGGGGEGTDLE